MRSTTAFLSLLAAAASAPAALAAPIPAELVAEWEARLAALSSHPSARAHKLSPAGAAALAEDAELSRVTIDNRHYAPAGAVPPSVVLATPRPIVTTYLMGLSPKSVRLSSVKDEAPSKEAPAPIRMHDANAQVEVVIVDTELEAAKMRAQETKKKVPATKHKSHEKSPSHDHEIPESLKMEAKGQHKVTRIEMPCYYAQLRRDYNDMMVISLVAVFLLVIVAVELWDSSSQQRDAEDAPIGAIKLEDDSGSEKRHLSVQASPMELASSIHPTSTEVSHQ